LVRRASTWTTRRRDHRVELALAGERGEIAPVAGQGLVLVLGGRVGHALAAAHRGQGLEQGIARHARLGENRLGRARVLRRREGRQQVLDADVLVLEARGRGLGVVEHGAQPLAQIHGTTLDAREPLHLFLGPAEQGLARHAELGEQRRHRAVGLLKERHQQVLGVQLLMSVLAGQPLRPLQGLLGFDRVAIALHG
jgi:hypothetical protein